MRAVAHGIGVGVMHYNSTTGEITASTDAAASGGSGGNSSNPRFHVPLGSYGFNPGTGEVFISSNWAGPLVNANPGTKGWDATNGNYEIPVDGDYFITATVMYNASVGTAIASDSDLTSSSWLTSIYLDNQRYASYKDAFPAHPSSATYRTHTHTINAIIPCTAGQRIKLQVRNVPNNIWIDGMDNESFSTTYGTWIMGFKLS